MLNIWILTKLSGIQVEPGIWPKEKSLDFVVCVRDRILCSLGSLPKLRMTLNS